MRVLLINPPSLSMFRALSFGMPPLGLLYVAAAAERAGHEVRVADLNVSGASCDMSGFDVVGIHSDTTRYGRALDLARKAKASGARVVMGGPHPCFVADEVLRSGTVDFVLKGEGEAAFPMLLEALAAGGGFGEIPGLIMLRDGEVSAGPPPERIRDVDSLPLPARHLLDMGKYSAARMGSRSVMPVHTSRGCPSACRFCSSSNFDGTRWRARSAESILDEIVHLRDRYGARAIAFMDDNFTLSPARIEALAEGVLRMGIDIHWWFFSRVDSVVRNPDVFTLLSRAGARSVFIGVESAATRTLRAFGKGIEPDAVFAAVDILRTRGFEILASYILGAPHETREDLRATIRLACELDTDTAQFTILTPYPGTPLFEDVKDRIYDRDWSHYDSIHPVFRLDNIGKGELLSMLLRAYMGFYARSRKSIHGFYRFLSNRRFGLNALAEIVKSRF